MAANDEIEKKKIKIELDIKQAKEQLDSLGKGIKQSEDRLKNLSKLLGGQLSDISGRIPSERLVSQLVSGIKCLKIKSSKLAFRLNGI